MYSSMWLEKFKWKEIQLLETLSCTKEGSLQICNVGLKTLLILNESKQSRDCNPKDDGIIDIILLEIKCSINKVSTISFPETNIVSLRCSAKQKGCDLISDHAAT